MGIFVQIFLILIGAAVGYAIGDSFEKNDADINHHL